MSIAHAIARPTATRPARGLGGDAVGLLPALLVDFAGAESLESQRGPALSITRTTGAMAFGLDGLLKWAPENTFKYSEDAVSGFPNLTAHVPAAVSSAGGPLGTQWTLGVVGNAFFHIYRYTGTYGSESALLMVLAKRGSARYLKMGSSLPSVFDWDTMEWVVEQAGHVGLPAEAHPFGDGWHWVGLHIGAQAASSYEFEIVPSHEASGSYTWAADGDESLLVAAMHRSRSANPPAGLPDYRPAPGASAYFSPRLSYDPLTGECLGYLYERSSTNLILQSSALDSAPWSVLVGQAVEADAAVCPDGSISADRFPEASSGSGVAILRQAHAFEGSKRYTLSANVKFNGRRWFSLVAVAGSQFEACFDVENGVLGSFVGGAVIRHIEDVGNGWYRCSMTFTSDAAPSTNVVDLRYSGGDQSSSTNYIRSGQSNFIWGVQLEQSGIASSPIPTKAATVTRSADNCHLLGVGATLIDQSRGSLVVEFVPHGTQVEYQSATGFCALEANDRRRGAVTATNAVGSTLALVFTTGPADWQSSASFSFGITAGQTIKLGQVYRFDHPAPGVVEFQAACNGVLGDADTTGQVFEHVLENIVLGANGTNLGPQSCNATFRRLAYYDTRISEAKLTSLTE